MATIVGRETPLSNIYWIVNNWSIARLECLSNSSSLAPAIDMHVHVRFFKKSFFLENLIPPLLMKECIEQVRVFWKWTLEHIKGVAVLVINHWAKARVHTQGPYCIFVIRA